MGVVHFMGLGRSVGAVTCAVDYIEHCLARRREGRSNPAIERLFAHSGVITHHEKNPGFIEEIVFITTREVIHEEINAYEYDGNRKPESVRSDLIRVMKQVWRTQDKDMGRQIRWCEVNPNNFFETLERLIKLAYLYRPRGRQGKEIWCNLTGGMNPINIALISMARFTGVATHLYLIDQSKEIQKRVKVIPEVAKNPKPNEDNYFVVVPFFSTHLTTLEQLEVLLELEAESHPISNEQLWSRLRANAKVSQQNPEAFKRELDNRRR
ncbi:MAG: hypothetical protein ACE5NG_18500 [bacterium]